MKKRVLLTGCAGFIGSHLTQRLLENDHFVVGVDNLITGTLDNIKEFLDNPNFEFIEKDAVAIEFQDAFTFNLIVHLASPASPVDFFRYYLEILKVNSITTYKLLELAKNSESVFVYVSTSEVYGNPLEHPQNEHTLGVVNHLSVRGAYDEGKRFGEALSYAYFRRYNMDIRIARIFNTYGPRMRIDDGRVIPSFFKAILDGKPLPIYGDGNQTRSFSYVDDTVEALFRLCTYTDLRGVIVNIGNPVEVKIIELAELIQKITGCKVGIELKPWLFPEEPKRRKPDITKAKEILGWDPVVCLEEGLKLTWNWFKTKYSTE